MTDQPTAPHPSEVPEVEDELGKADRVLRGMVLAHLATQLKVDPATTPTEAAIFVFDSVVCALLTKMGLDPVRKTLLVTFEATHDAPMNFMQVARAKDALSTIVQERRRQEAEQAKLIDLHGNALTKQ